MAADDQGKYLGPSVTHPLRKMYPGPRQVVTSCYFWTNITQVHCLHQEFPIKQNSITEIHNRTDCSQLQIFKILSISLGLSIICFESPLPWRLSATDWFLLLTIPFNLKTYFQKSFVAKKFLSYWEWWIIYKRLVAFLFFFWHYVCDRWDVICRNLFRC